MGKNFNIVDHHVSKYSIRLIMRVKYSSESILLLSFLYFLFDIALLFFHRAL